MKLALCGLQKPLRECSTKCAAFLSLWVVTRYFSDCRETLVVLCMHVGKPSKCMIYCNIQKCKFTKSGSTTLSCLCFFFQTLKTTTFGTTFCGWLTFDPEGLTDPCLSGGLWNGFFLQCQATSLKDAKLLKVTAQQILENTRKIRLPRKNTKNPTQKANAFFGFFFVIFLFFFERLSSNPESKAHFGKPQKNKKQKKTIKNQEGGSFFCLVSGFWFFEVFF